MITCNLLPTYIYAEPEQKICEKCLAKQDRRMKIIAILSGIAELARSLALLFSANPQDDKIQYNEAVCGIIAGACTLASQATRTKSSQEIPEIYELLQEPDVIKELKAMISNQATNNLPNILSFVEVNCETK